MTRYVMMLAAALVIAMAARDAIWPAEPELLIEEISSAAVHPAGGDWCDVSHPPPRPRVIGPYEPVIPFRPDQRIIS